MANMWVDLTPSLLLAASSDGESCHASPKPETKLHPSHPRTTYIPPSTFTHASRRRWLRTQAGQGGIKEKGASSYFFPSRREQLSLPSMPTPASKSEQHKERRRIPNAPQIPMPKVVTKILAGGADPSLEAEKVRRSWVRKECGTVRRRRGKAGCTGIGMKGLYLRRSLLCTFPKRRACALQCRRQCPACAWAHISSPNVLPSTALRFTFPHASCIPTRPPPNAMARNAPPSLFISFFSALSTLGSLLPPPHSSDSFLDVLAQAPVTGEWQKIPHEEDAAASSHSPSSFFHGILVTLYGEMAPRDLVRVCWFAGTLFFIIGGYWLLRSLKVRGKEGWRGGEEEGLVRV